MQNTTQQLEDQIKLDIDTLKVKRLMLKALKKEESKNTPFSMTRFGKAYLSTLRTITAPLAQLNKAAEKSIEHPYVAQRDCLVSKAQKLLDKTHDLDRKENEKKATKYAVKLAGIIMELEDFTTRTGKTLAQQSFLPHLRSEVERLRPPKDELKTEAIRATIEHAIKQGTGELNA